MAPRGISYTMNEVHRRSQRQGLTQRDEVVTIRRLDADNVRLTDEAAPYAASAPIGDGLVLWLPFDRASLQADGYAEWIANGRVSISGTGTLDHDARGASFEGVAIASGSVQLVGSRPAATSAWTMEFWVLVGPDTLAHSPGQLSPYPATAVVDEGGGGRALGLLRPATGELELWCRDTDGTFHMTSGGAVVANATTLVHLVATKGSDGIRFYVNGAEVA